LFLQDSSRLIRAWYPVHAGRERNFIMADRCHEVLLKTLVAMGGSTPLASRGQEHEGRLGE